MKKAVLFLIMVACAAWWSGCSKEQTSQPSKSHPENWVQATSREGHGEKVLTSGLESCASCHGSDFTGGASKVSCFKCHANYPHSTAWTAPMDSQSHSRYLAKTNFATASCTPCHGEDLQNSNGKTPCKTCHSLYPHASGWMQTSAATFHGAWVRNANWDLSACKICHGADFKGGDGKQPCYACHASYPHDAVWADPAAATSHVGYLRGNGHDLQPCQACHGADYLGGTSGKSCTLCHTGSNGPENCTLCHGSKDGIQPPKDTQGNTQETAIAVGRHKYHVLDKKYACILCHIMPAAYGDPGHVKDDTPGRAEISDLWQWNHATASCVTNCHANDTTKNYIWNH